MVRNIMDVSVVDGPEPTTFEPFTIRYEGLLATTHEMDLSQLGESLQGFAKAIAVAANFAYTGSTAVHIDALKVKVIAQPTEEHRCYEVWALIKPIMESKEFWIGAMGAAATIFAPIIAYILSSRKSEEMKHLSDALKLALSGNQAVTEKLVSTVEKLAEALNPSVRKALSPIDRSCTHIDVYAGDKKVQTLNSSTKASFNAGGARVSDHTKVFSGVISQFDMTSGTCKVLLDGQSERISANVVDPCYSAPNNAYATAMAAKTSITFLAKPELDGDGLIAKLYIFDTVLEDLEESKVT